MKTLLFLLVLLVGVAGCAAAATVNMGCTLPAFRADSLNCQLATTDTLKDLATVAVYVSTTSALTDSTLVLSASVPGQEGKPYNFSAQQPAWSTRFYWLITRDSGNRRACKSNVVSETVYGGPPARIADLHAR